MQCILASSRGASCMGKHPYELAVLHVMAQTAGQATK
jgi:hypothetical protein